MTKMHKELGPRRQRKTPLVFNRDKVFNTVANHLLKQKRKAYNDGTMSCMYRSPDGLKCAVGCLIPDKEYGINLEGCGIVSIIQNEEMPNRNHSLWKAIEAGVGPCTPKDMHLLRLLQNIHDDSREDSERTLVQVWAARLSQLAQTEKLAVFPELSRRIAGVRAGQTRNYNKKHNIT
jgi:hypothetical protein